MLKIVFGVLAVLVGVTAFYVGAASATGYLKRAAALNIVVTPPINEIAGDCVVQTRWVTSGGRRIQIERPVCY